MTTGLAQSVHVRLIRHANTLQVDSNLVLTRYATERLLYRLSRSAYADRFVLKGGLMLVVWLGESIRPTRDADLLGFGTFSDETMAQVFREVCAIPVEEDGVYFDANSIHVTLIRQEDIHVGQRVALEARLGQARMRVQVDIGVGDAVTPHPEWITYPSLLGFPKPKLRAYRPETSIAEKTHAMVTLGSINSRMRDFFDVHALAARIAFDGRILSDALRNTFVRRHTAFPPETPIALTPAFAALDGKRNQWSGFLRRNRLVAAPVTLDAAVEGVAAFIGPVIEAVAHNKPFTTSWPPGGPWR
mgnify:CR=1 FL=1